jgi:bifunctional DNA-binding transcriptional regulator/antitoxin component of YhaV-PrlF toxin-antitoxin module
MGTQTRTRRPPVGDYRRFVDERIDRAKRRIKSADAGAAIVFVVVAWICYVLLLVMIDQVAPLSLLVRTLLLACMVLATAVVLAVRVVAPLFLRVNALFAAKTLEAADPRMKNTVLSWVDLSQSGRPLPEPIAKAIGARAATDLARVRIEDAIQPRHVLASMYVLAAVVVAFCVFSFFTTKNFGPTLERVLLPLAGTAPPASTHLRIVFEPSTTNGATPAPIPVGGSLAVKARVERGKPEKVVAYIQAADSDYEEPHDFSRVDPDSQDFVLSLHQRQKSFSIRIVADDFRSETFLATVTPAPAIVEWSILYEPPAYTGQAPYAAPGPDVDGLEGSRVRVEAAANGAVEPGSGRLDVRMGGEEASFAMPVVDGSSDRIAGVFVLKADGAYSVLFRDCDGRAPDFRPNNHIRVRKDLPPTIEIHSPAEKEIDLPPDATVALRGRASDDFGLRKVDLAVRDGRSGELLHSKVFENPGDRLGVAQDFESTLDLAKLKLEPGDVLEYWVEAEDVKLPIANVTSTKSDRRLIRIVRPEPKDSQPPKDRKSEDSKSPDGSQEDSQPGKSSDSSNQGGEDEQADPSDHDSPRQGPGAAGEDAESDGRRGDASQADPDAAEDPSSDDRGQGSSASKTEGEWSDQDRESLEKLQRYFGEERSQAESDRRREPSREGREGDRGEDRAADLQDPKKQPSDPTAGTDAEKRDTTPNDASKADNAGETSAPPDPKQTGNSEGRPEGGPSREEERAAQGDEAPSDQPNNAGEQSPSDSSEPSSSESPTARDEAGKESNNRTADAQDGADEPSSAPGDRASQVAQKADPGAGEQSAAGETPRPDQATPGEPSQGKKGEEKGRAADSSPRAESEGDPNIDKQDRAHRTGPEESSASNAANSEGEAKQGESSNTGPSSSGGPSEEKGDHSNSTGQQEAKGQSAGKGDERQGQKSPGESDKDSPQAAGGGREESSKQSRAPGGESAEPKPTEGRTPQSEPSQNAEKPDGGEGSKPADSGLDQASDEPPPDPMRNTPPGSPDGSGNWDPKRAPQGSGKRNDDLDDSGDAADPDDLKRGSNLVLRKLEEELSKKKVDPELLKRMGWTEEDARRFYDRLRQQVANAEAADPIRGRAREGFGGGADLRKRSERAAGAAVDANQGLETGRRTAAPPEIRKRYEAYTRSLSEAAGDPQAPTPRPPQE